MEVNIDKFGRILIPKNIRKQLGIQPDQVWSLEVNEPEQTLSLIPKGIAHPAQLEIKDGLPVFTHEAKIVLDIDPSELIQKDRESRDNQLSGW